MSRSLDRCVEAYPLVCGGGTEQELVSTRGGGVLGFFSRTLEGSGFRAVVVGGKLKAPFLLEMD